MDEISWLDRLELFRWPLLSALVAGIVLPAVGAFLLVRRTSFHGIVLPQFAAAGVVFAYAILGWWIETIGLGGLTLDDALHDPHAASTFGLVWGGLFTLGGILLLVVSGRRGGSESARAAAGFAVASAAVLVLGRLSPIGRGPVDELLAGEVLGVGVHDFEVLAAALAVAGLLLAWFGRDLLLTSYDREAAIVLGKRATTFETLFQGIVGLAVAAGTLTLGPILVFGLLVVPPLAARPWSRSMGGFVGLSLAIGAMAALIGETAALEWDLPLGPSVVLASALFLAPAAFASRRT
ncbi:MAG: metal ABC transporter permease [Planctomycetota bacterium]|nr:metal ABC transporter permease [Planctomycetota bacterium]